MSEERTGLDGARHRGMPPAPGRCRDRTGGFQAAASRSCCRSTTPSTPTAPSCSARTSSSVLTEVGGRPAVFEADGFDPTTHTGWSVCVHGAGREITAGEDPAAVRLLEMAVIPWAPGSARPVVRHRPRRAHRPAHSRWCATLTSAGSPGWCRDRCPDRTGQRRSGARPHRPGRRPDPAARQRRAGHAARRDRSGRRRTRRCPGPPDARPPRPPVPARRLRRSPAPHLLLPLRRDPPVLPAGHRRSGPEPLQRDAVDPAGPHPRSARPGGGLAARSPRVLQPRAQRRLRRLVHRSGPVLPRGQPPHAAHVRPQPDPHQPDRGLDRVGPPPRRGAPGADR